MMRSAGYLGISLRRAQSACCGASRSKQLVRLASSTSAGSSDPKASGEGKTWSSALSMGATTLCFAHCTILPFVLAAMPIMNFAVPEAAQASVHTILHTTSVVFVLPVGMFALIQHYRSHQRADIAGLGIAGLATIGITHGPCVFSWLPHVVPHDMHQIVAGVGCMALLGSQYWSRSILQAAAVQAGAAGTQKSCCSGASTSSEASASAPPSASGASTDPMVQDGSDVQSGLGLGIGITGSNWSRRPGDAETGPDSVAGEGRR